MKKLVLTISVIAITMVSFGQDHGNATSSSTTDSYGLNAGTSGSYNNYFGNQAGENDTGTRNNFFGWSSGRDNSGERNAFFGHSAGRFNNGERNVFIGYASGYNNNLGKRNVFLGTYSGLENTNGSWNTYIGYEAGLNNLTGSLNVFIGHNAGKNETTSNKLYIDNSGTTEPLIYGDFSSDFVTFNGNVGIGTSLFDDNGDLYKLSVDGKIRATAVKVYTGWADYVFEADYVLPTLEEVELYIQEHGHLRDIPSAEEVEASGIELGEMNKLLLQKIEELTLYTIELKKEVQELKTKIDK